GFLRGVAEPAGKDRTHLDHRSAGAEVGHPPGGARAGPLLRGLLGPRAAARRGLRHRVPMAAVYARLSGVALQQAYHADGLRTAMQSRLTIGAAQGILMERYNISLDRSFEVLRRRSNETNVKLRDVALAIVQQTDEHTATGGASQRTGSRVEMADSTGSD